MTQIIEASVTGTEIERIISRQLAPALQHEESDKAIISLITMAFLLMKHDIGAEELQAGVRGVSEYMVLVLSGTEDHPDLPAHEKRLAQLN